MQTIDEVKKKIERTKKEAEANNGAIHPARLRLKEVDQRVSNVQREIDDLKAERQRALADGKNAAPITEQIEALEKERLLKGEESTGLNVKIRQLETNEITLTGSLKEYEFRILQLQSVASAKKYNEQAEALASVVRELTITQAKIDKLSGSAKQRRVVYGPEIGALKQIPRLFFEDDCCELEDLVARHREFAGTHPSNLTAQQGGYFFDRDMFMHDFGFRAIG